MLRDFRRAQWTRRLAGGRAVGRRICESILDAIGGTPLVRLTRVAAGLPVELFGKLESVNPGGSFKDRIGLAMVEAAERDGRLAPGGVIVEATAGNTGVGLAQAAVIKGYRCIFVLPDKMSREKIDLLQAYGAEVIVTPTVGPDDPANYHNLARRLAKETPGAWFANQFDNPDNPLAHYRNTGPEIWQALEGRLDVFVAGMGTCGMMSGAGRYLKEQNSRLVVVGVDPEGSIYSGDSPRTYKVEGIGGEEWPGIYDPTVVDEMIRVADADSFRTARRLAREEGILCGGSSGAALAAALRYAGRLRKPARMVVVLCDTGRNYLTKLYSDEWMRANGFDV